MAKALWGNVYYSAVDNNERPVDICAGELRQEAGGRCSFTYDTSYRLHPLARPIAHAMPLCEAPFILEFGLPPFFHNLAAEGWLRSAQARALSVNPDDRFALLLGFGNDLAGAVSVIDPDPQQQRSLNHEDAVTKA